MTIYFNVFQSFCHKAQHTNYKSERGSRGDEVRMAEFQSGLKPQVIVSSSWSPDRSSVGNILEATESRGSDFRVPRLNLSNNGQLITQE